MLHDVLRPRLVAADEEVGVEVFSLARQHVVVIKAGWLGLQMPLADHGGEVARLLHLLRQVLSLRRQRAIEIGDAIGLRILPGEDRGAARGADGVRAKNAVKPHAFRGQLVDRRRGIQLREPTPVGSDGLRGVVIRHDVEDVRGRGSSGVQRDNRGEQMDCDGVFHVGEVAGGFYFSSGCVCCWERSRTFRLVAVSSAGSNWGFKSGVPTQSGRVHVRT